MTKFDAQRASRVSDCQMRFVLSDTVREALRRSGESRVVLAAQPRRHLVLREAQYV